MGLERFKEWNIHEYAMTLIKKIEYHLSCQNTVVIQKLANQNTATF